MAKKQWLKNKWFWIYIVLGAAIIALNILAWNSTAFCDGYIKYIFPIWVNTYGRLTGMFPFSVGEIMLVLAVVLVAVAAVLWIPAFVAAAVCNRHQEKAAFKERENGCSRVCKSIIKGSKCYYLFIIWTVLFVSLIMTLNCLILYHASTFSGTYFEADSKKYTLEELITVRNMVVEECNRLSALMERDAEGTILYSKDVGQQAIISMKQLGQTYDQLDGYYPHPKPLYASDFFSQQYMCGYYFPFSMEANYNDVMYIMNKPATMCHELAHLRGYIFEDEANFISYLACIQSEELMFQYSGYLSVLNYLDNDFYRAVGRDGEKYWSEVHILEQVERDNVFVTEKEWDRINAKALIDTETVEQVSDVIVDTTLKVNGVTDGIISYNRVVELLLQYYRQEGFLQ